MALQQLKLVEVWTAHQTLPLWLRTPAPLLPLAPVPVIAFSNLVHELIRLKLAQPAIVTAQRERKGRGCSRWLELTAKLSLFLMLVF